MRKLTILLMLLIGISMNSFATRWVARVTTGVNLREGPSTDYGIITKIPKNAFVFYDDEDSEDGFLRVIFIDKDISGYISARFVSNYKEVEVDQSGQLQMVGSSESYNPELNIKNKSNYTMTLRIGDSSYKFAPYSSKTIEVSPGTITFTASSPGVIPYVGKDVVQANYSYDWIFYVSTTRK